MNIDLVRIVTLLSFSPCSVRGSSLIFLFSSLLAKGTTPLVEASIELVKDPKEDMTFGRRIALSLIEKAWYNPPAADDDEDLRKSVNEIQGNSFYLGRKKPSLEKAWTYFEHVALNRFVGEDDDEPKSRNVVQQCLRRLCRGDRQLHRAELGVTDRKTKLYDPFNTPHSQVRGLIFG
jgi:hypothetical protein